MRNWGGNIEFSADIVHRPRSLDEAQRVIADARSVRVLGSRHSFNEIADAAEIVDTSGLPERFELDIAAMTVRVNGSMTYGRLVELLAPHDLALHNLASLPHISIAGAIATGTHGSGDRNGNLASAVVSIEFITGSGEVIEFSRGDVDFGGAVVSLGALGLVSAVTLDVEPSYQVEQRVFDGPSIAALAADFDLVFSAAYSVSAFTRWRGDIEQIWLKHRADQGPMAASARVFFTELAPAGEQRHPIIDLDATSCTEQMGVAGSWAERLPHFRMDFTPSAGEEIQSEFFVGREHAADALAALAEAGELLADAIMVSEIRTVAADTQWMSPHVGRDSVAFHFTWLPDPAQAAEAARIVARALAGFAPRAHWGKVFDPSLIDLDHYPDRGRFLELVNRVDPTGTFINPWFERTITP